MIKKILKYTIDNFQSFLIVWVVVILVNQIFIFGACFEPYCLIAALPHTSLIAILLSYFINSNISEPNNNTRNSANSKNESTDTENNIKTIPFCPKCNSKMILRTARQGKYKGEEFWGCSEYPNCRGIRKT